VIVGYYRLSETKLVIDLRNRSAEITCTGTKCIRASISFISKSKMDWNLLLFKERGQVGKKIVLFIKTYLNC
jgi:hypothetical protein